MALGAVDTARDHFAGFSVKTFTVRSSSVFGSHSKQVYSQQSTVDSRTQNLLTVGPSTADSLQR